MIASLSLLGFASVLGSLLISGVEGHGYIQNVTIVGGQTYPGWDPNYDPYAVPIPGRIVRKIPDDGPVLDVTSPDIACNKGGETGAALLADVNAGGQVTFTMNRWPDDHLGPVMHYMASCEGDCKSFDATKGKWFKVDEDGYDNGVWASTKLIKNNLQVTMTVPAQLKAGQYLIRHEIVALHDASQPQFYPGCAQVNVHGSGSQEPAASDIVSFPGAYNNFKWPDIWADGFKSFTLPSPPIAALASGGTNNAGSPPPPPPPESSPSATPSHASVATSAARPSASSSLVTTAPASSSTGKCKSRMVKRRAGTEHAVKRHAAAANAKRHH